MIKGNFHTHTNFCDGENSPEEIVEEAIKNGFVKLGFSGHSYLKGCPDWTMDKEKAFLYRNEILRLKEKYKNKINIFLGVEQDFYSPLDDLDKYEYVIGSVHCFNFNNELVAVDASRFMLLDIVGRYFEGDVYKMTDAYYELVSQVVEKTNADIIGHFDLVTKYNSNNILFDENCERYKVAAKNAVDKLVKTGKYFELNTGAMARGHRERAYPDGWLISYIKEKGGKFILTSDCHNKNKIDYAFDKYISQVDTMTLNIK